MTPTPVGARRVLSGARVLWIAVLAAVFPNGAAKLLQAGAGIGAGLVSGLVGSASAQYAAEWPALPDTGSPEG